MNRSFTEFEGEMFGDLGVDGRKIETRFYRICRCKLSRLGLRWEDDLNWEFTEFEGEILETWA